MIGIVNYGLGNLAAFQVAFQRLGREAMLIDEPAQFDDADALILPGVGAFDVAMSRLNHSGLRDGLVAAVDRGQPVLGVCVGMQILAAESEEGVLPGLALIPGVVRKFHVDDAAARIRCPHMGWNRVDAVRELPICEGIDEERFYFLHSYYFDCPHDENVACTSRYGREFHAMVFRENVYGVQFHPEKSHDAGLRLLDNFAKIAA